MLIGCFLVFEIINFTSVLSAEFMITEKQAVEIANKEIEKLKYNVKDMEIKISRHSDPWNDYLPKEDNTEYFTTRKNKLSGKTYWAVYYSKAQKPGTRTFGGDICIFIDAKTGDVLTFCRGE